MLAFIVTNDNRYCILALYKELCCYCGADIQEIWKRLFVQWRQNFSGIKYTYWNHNNARRRDVLFPLFLITDNCENIFIKPLAAQVSLVFLWELITWPHSFVQLTADFTYSPLHFAVILAEYKFVVELYMNLQSLF